MLDAVTIAEIERIFEVTDRLGIHREMLVIPLLQIAFFVGLGIAASALLRRHRPRARGWFFAGCVAPVAAFTIYSGLRLSAVVALIALCFAFVQLRLARDAQPLA